MKTPGLLILCLILLLWEKPVISQNKYCQNLSFEMGDFTNWVGYDWMYHFRSDGRTVNTSNDYPPTLSDLNNPSRQQIMTDTSAVDPKTGGQLRIIPKGYRYSARLGDWFNQAHFQSLKYTMTVDSFNALLMVKFAVVLQNPTDHPLEEQPRFKFTIYDQGNNVLDKCTDYDVYSSSAENFKDFGQIKWRDWTAVGINLLNYIGQSVTVEFQTQDCTWGGHYGYTYFVAECSPLRIAVSYCKGDNVAVLKAPDGFESYSWSDPKGNNLGKDCAIQLDDPVNNTVYSCTMQSFTGCVITLQTMILKADYKADFYSKMVDCFNNKVEIVNTSSQDKGYLEYFWNFGDGGTSQDKDPVHDFATSGKHNVSLTINRPGSTCKDSIRKTIESFSPPLVGISGDTTYCPGLSTVLRAYGAWNYTWNNATDDSIEVKAPGGRYWVVGHSSTGCHSDTIYRTVIPDPEWAIENKSDTMLCIGGQVKLSVEGAVKYLWNTVKKDTARSITVNKPGIYKVTGINQRGCEKAKDINVREVRFNPDFYSRMLDCRSNKVQIVNTSPADSGYLYKWDFGDHNIIPEISPQFTFSTSGRHKVMLVTTKPAVTCVDTLYKTIESFSPPLVGIAGKTEFCPGDSVVLKAYGAWNYLWSNASREESVVVRSPGNRYWLIGYSSTGCVSDTIFRDVFVEPYWELVNQCDSALCAGGDKAVLSVLGADKYFWDPTKQTSSSIEINSPGRYVVTGTSTLGCQKTLTVNVKEYPLPVVEINASTLLLNPRNRTLSVSVVPEDGVSYDWDMGDGTHAEGTETEHTYMLESDINKYTVSVAATDTLGCSKRAFVAVEVTDGIFIPNVFSPNGDGINDLFMPEAGLQIMDRNGLILYEGTAGWDGTYNGRLMNPDTYFYLVRYNDRGGKERSRKGFVALLR